MRQTFQDRQTRKRQKFVLSGSLQTNIGDDSVKDVDFNILKNVLVNKRLAAILKRPGSLTETVAGGLGVPVGFAEYLAPASSSPIPVTRTLLANFAGANFYKLSGTTWSSVTLDTSGGVSLGASKQMQSAQLGGYLYMCAGTPVYWSGSGNIKRVGIPAPVSAPTTSVAGTGITATTGWQYMYTWYNSANGLESDWSPLSASTGPVANKTVTVTMATTASNLYDQKKIYRTFDGGASFYLVATIGYATATYADTTPDASLTSPSKEQFHNALPPSSAYIMTKYAQRIWMVDGSNPYKLVFSEAYTGADVDAHYFPNKNYVITNEPITGLAVLPGKLLVFHPRSISQITGGSTADFALSPYKSGIGTMFANSIAYNGQYLLFLAESGWCVIDALGYFYYISREIDLDLRGLLSNTWNNTLYASAVWSPNLREFIVLVTTSSTGSAPWETLGSGALAEWQDATTLVTDIWEDATSPSSVATTRVKMWSWNPDLSNPQSYQNRWSEHAFPQFSDLNSTNAYPVCMYHPLPSSDSLDSIQDKTYIGYWSGTAGFVLSAFRRDRAVDDGNAITSTVMTASFSPGEENGNFKRFFGIEFLGAYNDPTVDGACTIQYLMDFDDPQLRDYSTSLVSISDATDIKNFPQGKMRKCHLLFTDTSTSLEKLLLSDFYIHFRERTARDGR